ncbi:MAG: ferrochelatase [Rhodospirillaceae bacterium]
MTKTGRIAVILFSMGGPDCLAAVKPFLFNIFNDYAMIRLPQPLRYFLAWYISTKREKSAQHTYSLMGGKSPLLENTLVQAQALENALGQPENIKVFISMRYWMPFSIDTARQVKLFNPDKIITIPLYPQWSTTTSASSIANWIEACKYIGLSKPTRNICCYPTMSGFIKTIVTHIRVKWNDTVSYGKPRILFSAHGLPEKIINNGDPYQWQCESTARAIVSQLNVPDLDWVSCYQSRVGPLKWIGPETNHEIERAGRDKVPVILVPIAFVSEHSETLVELDIDYRKLAERCGVPYYSRIQTVGSSSFFIDGLTSMVKTLLIDGSTLCSESGQRACPSSLSDCPL